MINCCSTLTSTRAANVIASAALVTAALICMWWTPGDWWVATPRPSRWYVAAGVLASFLAALGWAWRYSARSYTPDRAEYPDANTQQECILVIYASETGFAEALAQCTRDQLQNLNCRVELAPIDAITVENLVDARRALFIASTAGQGDPPDHAIEFSESLMQQTMRLSSLHFGVLALGDRSYDEFCEFGHQLASWLHACGAKALFDVVEVDDGDAAALQHWECCVESISQTESMQK